MQEIDDLCDLEGMDVLNEIDHLSHLKDIEKEKEMEVQDLEGMNDLNEIDHMSYVKEMENQKEIDNLERMNASMAENGYLFMHENYTNIFYLPSVCEIV